MFVLMLADGDRTQYIGGFDSIETGRMFLQRVPGYTHEQIEDGGWSFEEEKIALRALPDLAMIDYNGYRIPISRFSFEEDPMVIWIELDHLDRHGMTNPLRTARGGLAAEDSHALCAFGAHDDHTENRNIVEDSLARCAFVARDISDGTDASEARRTPVISRGATRIDAYSIDNKEVEEYVRSREAKYRECKAYFESRGYEVSRECFGSEDGEVLFIRKGGEERWRFFTHMDPSFLDLDPEEEMGEWER